MVIATESLFSDIRFMALLLTGAGDIVGCIENSPGVCQTQIYRLSSWPFTWDVFYKQRSPKIRIWVSNYNHSLIWDAITHPCLNFSCNLVKPTLKLGHGWVIISSLKYICDDISMTGEVPAKRASNAENVSVWWRHHETRLFCSYFPDSVRLRMVQI